MRLLTSSLPVRATAAGIAGAVAWVVGMMLFFGPAQRWLANPSLQSEKMLGVFVEQPQPRAAETPWVVPLGVLIISTLWAWVYAWLASQWSGAWWQRGLRFWVVSWVLMVPWFEFYLPWNVLREPLPLVALEMGCWAGVLLCVAMAIAGVEGAMRPRMQR